MLSLNMLNAAGAVTGALAVPLVATTLAGPPALPAGDPLPAAIVEIAGTTIDYPLPGEFLAGGRPAAAPVEKTAVPPFRIMRQQVSRADYDRCVADGACAAADAPPAGVTDVPATGVSWLDAQAYADWYSTRTGEAWRLPTAPEMAVAAGERFAGETYSAAADDADNPAVRWLRLYREEAAARRLPDPAPKPRGHYGPNALGVEDFGGNVWEWTSTCHARVTLGAAGDVETVTENCGARVLEGRHRATMSSFVRDGKSGGCAVGTPPENLGFRLVRDEPRFPVLAALAARLGVAGPGTTP